MSRYLMTHSLLGAWLRSMKDNPFEEGDDPEKETALEEFMHVLRREKTPTTPAMQSGIDFEDLVTAILIVPAATARNLARNSRQLFFLSLVFSYVSCAGGLLVSAQQWANVPAGAAIVLLACAMFAVSFVAARLKSK